MVSMSREETFISTTNTSETKLEHDSPISKETLFIQPQSSQSPRVLTLASAVPRARVPRLDFK